jgi:hypothetical protein
MTAKRAGIILLALLVVGLAAGAYIVYQVQVTYASPPRIDIKNNADVDLQNLVLEGPGYRLELGRLPAHASTSVVVHPMGEASPKLSFTVGSEDYSASDMAYIEEHGGYVVVITVDNTLAIEADSHLMWLW